MIPLWAQIRVQTGQGRGVRLWLPLFLAWLLLLVLAPLWLPVLLVVALFSWVNPWRYLALGWGVLSGLHGLDVDVKSPDANVLIRVI